MYNFKNFGKCEELEACIRDMEVILIKLPLPDIIPTSRHEVELYLSMYKFGASYYSSISNVDTSVGGHRTDLNSEMHSKMMEKYKYMETNLVNFPNATELNTQFEFHRYES